MTHQKTLEEVEEDFRNRVIEDLDKLLALWKAGWSYKKIADEFRCTEDVVIKYLAMAIKRRRKRKKCQE